MWLLFFLIACRPKYRIVVLHLERSLSYSWVVEWQLAFNNGFLVFLFSTLEISFRQASSSVGTTAGKSAFAVGKTNSFVRKLTGAAWTLKIAARPQRDTCCACRNRGYVVEFSVCFRDTNKCGDAFRNRKGRCAKRSRTRITPLSTETLSILKGSARTLWSGTGRICFYRQVDGIDDTESKM